MRDQGVVLCAVGDIALGDHPLCTGFGTHSRNRLRSSGFPFQRVRASLRGADVVFGNLECTLSESGLRRNDYHSVQMRGWPAYVDGLKAAGFGVLNVANNHSLQHGAGPFVETVELLRGAGIGVCGVNPSDCTRCVPEVIEAKGLRVAFVACSTRPRQYFTREPLYSEAHLEHLVEDVAAARATSDAVVVSLHWGDEFIDRPSAAEIEFGHRVMDAGADLIIGHHPHVLRGVERYGRGYIAYSLGNFVCDMLWDERLRESAILECRLTRGGASDLSLRPVRINDDLQPVPLEGEAAEPVRARLARLAAELTDDRSAWSSPEAVARYHAAADAAHREVREKAHRYFLKNAYRFPPRILIQQLVTYARNRVAERVPGARK